MADTKDLVTGTIIGDFIRSCHPAMFRSGEWAVIVGVERHEFHYRQRIRPRPVYRVKFTDGTEDLWPVNDARAQYEFRGRDANASVAAS